MKYFTTLRSEGADRNILKGKTGESLGHQGIDQDELKGDSTGFRAQGGSEAV